MNQDMCYSNRERILRGLISNIWSRILLLYRGISSCTSKCKQNNEPDALTVVCDGGIQPRNLKKMQSETSQRATELHVNVRSHSGAWCALPVIFKGGSLSGSNIFPYQFPQKYGKNCSRNQIARFSTGRALTSLTWPELDCESFWILHLSNSVAQHPEMFEIQAFDGFLFEKGMQETWKLSTYYSSLGHYGDRTWSRWMLFD